MQMQISVHISRHGVIWKRCLALKVTAVVVNMNMLTVYNIETRIKVQLFLVAKMYYFANVVCKIPKIFLPPRRAKLALTIKKRGRVYDEHRVQ